MLEVVPSFTIVLIVTVEILKVVTDRMFQDPTTVLSQYFYPERVYTLIPPYRRSPVVNRPS